MHEKFKRYLVMLINFDKNFKQIATSLFDMQYLDNWKRKQEINECAEFLNRLIYLYIHLIVEN